MTPDAHWVMYTDYSGMFHSGTAAASSALAQAQISGNPDLVEQPTLGDEAVFTGKSSGSLKI